MLSRAGRLGVLVVSIAALWAWNVARAQSQAVWNVYTTAQGLTGNVVYDVFEERGGGIWFGTDRGASLFEDGHWTSYTADSLVNGRVALVYESVDGAHWFGTYGGVDRLANGVWLHHDVSSDPPFNRVTIAHELHDGSIWFGCDGGGEVHYQGGQWTAGKGPSHIVVGIQEDLEGGLWFAGRAQGVACLRDTTWTTYTLSDGLPSSFVTCITVAPDSSVWFGAEDCAIRFKHGQWTKYTVAQGLAHRHVTAALASRDGSVWLGTEGGLSRFQNGVWSSFHPDSIAGDTISTIVEASDGTLWVGTTTGLSERRDGAWTNYRTAQGLGDDRINRILETRDGSLWLGTNGGATHFEEGVWTRYSTGGGLVHNHVNAVLRSSDGSYWFGTEIGLSRFKDGAWSNSVGLPEIPNATVNAIIETRDGSVWFGTHYNASQYVDGRWVVHDVGDPADIVSHTINDMLEAADGALWFATEFGASRLHGDTLQRIRYAPGTITDRDRSKTILETPDGAIWLGTLDGVLRFSAGTWTPFTTDSGLPSDKVTSSMRAADGSLWFGTDGGGLTRRSTAGTWSTYDVASTGRGLADDHVRAVFQSADGALWFGTTGGVSELRDGVWSTYMSADGLADNHVSAIWESPDRTMWFGTESGVSRLKPDAIEPVTLLQQVPDTLIGTTGTFFGFVGSDSRTPTDLLKYSTAVAPDSTSVADLVWTPFEFTATRVVTVPDNGRYTFYVRSRDAWGNVDGSPASWTFTVDITQPTVTFNSHRSSSIVAGDVVLIGNAYDASPTKDFDRYALEYGRGSDRSRITTWRTDRLRFPHGSSAEIVNDTLAVWSTQGLDNDTYWLRLSARDRLGHTSEVLLSLVVVKASQLVEAARGAHLTIEGELDLTLQPGALTRDTRMVVMRSDGDAVVPPSDPRVTFAHVCYRILGDGAIVFAKAATLEIAYPESLLVPGGAALTLYQSPDAVSRWTRIGGSVDAARNRLIASISSTGSFGLFLDGTDGGGHGISNVTITPRVMQRRGAGAVNHVDIAFELGQASAGTIRIYSRSGRRVATVLEGQPLARGINVAQWDGKDGDKHACADGLYLVTIEANGTKSTKTLALVDQ